MSFKSPGRPSFNSGTLRVEWVEGSGGLAQGGISYTKKPWYMKLLLFKQEEIPIATGIEKLKFGFKMVLR